MAKFIRWLLGKFVAPSPAAVQAGGVVSALGGESGDGAEMLTMMVG